MNRIRAYFDRIQGRLLAAFALGALGMAVIGFVSMRAGGYTEQIADDLSRLQLRSDHSFQLYATISDQHNATQQYLIGRQPAVLADADSIAAVARRISTNYRQLEGLDSLQLRQLDAIAASQDATMASIDSARADVAAGEGARALERMAVLDSEMRELRSRIRALNAGELRTLEQQTNAFVERIAGQRQLLAGILVITAIVVLVFGVAESQGMRWRARHQAADHPRNTRRTRRS
jgi:CHASE3 domain sensor protein